MNSHRQSTTIAPLRSKARALYFRAHVDHWLGRDRAATALCLQAIAIRDYFKAHRLLAQLNLPGPDYLHVLKRIHQHVKPATYVEIGVSRGDSFRLVRPETRAVGIDPSPTLRHTLRPNQRVFAQTSDEFFARHDVIAELGGPVRMAFMDGMHQFEYALRDFANLEAVCAPDSLIFVHDCYPLDAQTSTHERATTFWSGDIWRLTVLLKRHRPDLRISTIGAAPTGLGVISRLDPYSRLIKDHLPELIAEGLAISFDTIAARKAEALNLVANDWERVRALL